VHRLRNGDGINRCRSQASRFGDTTDISHLRVSRRSGQLRLTRIGRQHQIEMLCERDGRLPIAGAAIPDGTARGRFTRDPLEQLGRIARPEARVIGR
jgi:hypothetical protein